VQKAEPIDIAYVDVTKDHAEHPHKGAMDANGNPGYVPDETGLRKNPPPFNVSNHELTHFCSIRDDDYRVLTNKVKLDIVGDKHANDSGKKRVSLFCMIYSYSPSHNRIPFIQETWG
jgi:hypothetical protein